MKDTRKTIFKTCWKPLATCGITAALAAGGALAYFTDTETVTNDFSVANALDIEVSEPSWDATKAQDMVPLQSVAKDPVVTNKDESVDAYAFVQVRVPVASFRLGNTSGSPEVTASSHPLFSYTVNADWTQLGSTTTADGYQTSVYAYNKTLKPSEQTTAAFDTVTLANIVDGSLVTSSYDCQIIVTGYGIQAEGFTTAASAWSAYTGQNIN